MKRRKKLALIISFIMAFTIISPMTSFAEEGDTELPVEAVITYCKADSDGEVLLKMHLVQNEDTETSNYAWDVFEIYRSQTGEEGTYEYLDFTPSDEAGFWEGTEYFDYDTAGGKTYYYKVRAAGYSEDNYGFASYDFYSQFSEPAKAQTGFSLTKPVLKVNFYGSSSIKLSWNRVESAGGYKIFRATKKSGSYKLIKTIKSGSTKTFIDKNLVKHKKYYYKVQAYRVLLESGEIRHLESGEINQ